MAVTIRTLTGQLPASQAALYTVPGGIKAYVKAVSGYNTGGGAEAVVIYLTVDGVSATVAAPTLAANESFMLTGIGLKAGDSIDGTTTTATTVDYSIEIVEDNE